MWGSVHYDYIARLLESSYDVLTRHILVEEEIPSLRGIITWNNQPIQLRNARLSTFI